MKGEINATEPVPINALPIGMGFYGCQNRPKREPLLDRILSVKPVATATSTASGVQTTHLSKKYEKGVHWLENMKVGR